MTTGYEPMLPRLLSGRWPDVRALALACGVPEAELAAVFDGTEPSALLLRQLAPALGWHASDLFLIAGIRVPEEVAPAERNAAGAVSSFVWDLTYVPEAGRRVHTLLRSAVRNAPLEPVRTPTHKRWFVPGFGAMLMRLFGNRNMAAVDAVQVLYMLTGFGPWSSATLSMVGGGRKDAPSELVAASAVVLGVQVGDLGALAGMQAPEPVRWTHPATTEAVELIWEARGIPGEQMAQLARQSHMIRHEYDEVDQGWPLCHCSLFRGSKTATPPEMP